MMKAMYYVMSLIVGVSLYSCAAGVYAGSPRYDDLYYNAKTTPTEQRVSQQVRQEQPLANQSPRTNVPSPSATKTAGTATSIDLDNYYPGYFEDMLKGTSRNYDSVQNNSTKQQTTSASTTIYIDLGQNAGWTYNPWYYDPYWSYGPYRSYYPYYWGNGWDWGFGWYGGWSGWYNPWPYYGGYWGPGWGWNSWNWYPGYHWTGWPGHHHNNQFVPSHTSRNTVFGTRRNEGRTGSSIVRPEGRSSVSPTRQGTPARQGTNIIERNRQSQERPTYNTTRNNSNENAGSTTYQRNNTTNSNRSTNSSAPAVRNENTPARTNTNTSQPARQQQSTQQPTQQPTYRPASSGTGSSGAGTNSSGTNTGGQRRR